MSYFLEGSAQLSDEDFKRVVYKNLKASNDWRAEKQGELKNHLKQNPLIEELGYFNQLQELKDSKIKSGGVCIVMVSDWMRRKFTKRKGYFGDKYAPKQNTGMSRLFSGATSRNEKRNSLMNKLWTAQQRAVETKFSIKTSRWNKDTGAPEPVKPDDFGGTGRYDKPFEQFTQAVEADRLKRKPAAERKKATSGFEKLHLRWQGDSGMMGHLSAFDDSCTRHKIEICCYWMTNWLEDLVEGEAYAKEAGLSDHHRGLILRMSMASGEAGHAVGFYYDSERLSYFDPNIGEFASAAADKQCAKVIGGLWADWLFLYYPEFTSFDFTHVSLGDKNTD